MTVNLAFQKTLSDKVQGLVRNGKGGIDRNIYMSKQLAKELKVMISERSKDDVSRDYLFLNNTNKNNRSVRSIQYLIKKVSKKANIRKVITPHTFRRSFATALYDQGEDIYKIQKLLGHTSVATTLRYIKMSSKDLETHDNPLNKLYGIEKKLKDKKRILFERVGNLETKVEKVFKKVSYI